MTGRLELVALSTFMKFLRNLVLGIVVVSAALYGLRLWEMRDPHPPERMGRGTIATPVNKIVRCGLQRALRFSDLEGEQNGVDEAAPLAGHVLSPADVRQLTVYAELVRRRELMATTPDLMLLYPFVGPPAECIPDRVAAWNGSTFWLMPVLVRAQDFVGTAIRFPVFEAPAIDPVP